MAKPEDLNTQEELIEELNRIFTEDDLPTTEKVWQTIRDLWRDVPFSVVLGAHVVLKVLPTMAVVVFAISVFVYEDYHSQPISRMRRLGRKIDALVRRKRELGLPTGPPSREQRSDRAEESS